MEDAFNLRALRCRRGVREWAYALLWQLARHLQPHTVNWSLATKRWIDKQIGSLLLAGLGGPARLLGWLLGRAHGFDPPPQHVVCIKLMGIGSVLLAADALAALRVRWPEARLVLLTSRSMVEPLRATGLFDAYLVIEDRSPMRLFVSAGRALVACWRLPGRWVFDLEVYSRLTPVFSLLTLARNRFGFVVDVVGQRRHLNTHNVFFNRLRSVSDNYAELVQAAGAQPTPHTWSFPAYPQPRKPHRRPYLAINNTCSALSLERKLTDEQLADVCRYLRTNGPWKLALLGSPADRPALEQWRQQHLPDAEGIEIVAGSLGFPEYYTFLYEQCAGLLSIDSAPLHMGRRLGLPVLSVWGPTHPLNYLYPLRESDSGAVLDQVLYLAVACSPCVHHSEVLPCGGHNICIRNLNPFQLHQALDQWLHTLDS